MEKIVILVAVPTMFPSISRWELLNGSPRAMKKAGIDGKLFGRMKH